MKVLVFNEQLLVYLSSLFEVTSQIVKCSHAQLVLDRISEGTVIGHDLIFIANLLRQLEEQSVF